VYLKQLVEEPLISSQNKICNSITSEQIIILYIQYKIILVGSWQHGNN